MGKYYSFTSLKVNKMKKIYIENINDYIFVDEEDFERVNFYKWHKSYAHDTHRFLTQIVVRRISFIKSFKIGKTMIIYRIFT